MMVKRKRALIILVEVVLCLGLWVGPCWGWVEDAVDKAQAERVLNLVADTNAKQIKADEAMQYDAQEKVESSWEEFPKVDRIRLETKMSKKVVDKAGESASRAMETLSSAASDATKYTSSKTGEEAETVCGEAASEVLEFGLERAANVYDQVKERINLATNKVLDKSYDAKELTEEGTNFGVREDVFDVKDEINKEVEKATTKYNEAKEKVQDSCKLAKEKMNKEAKDKYEAAKENASQAAGDLGETLRENTGEL